MRSSLRHLQLLPSRLALPVFLLAVFLVPPTRAQETQLDASDGGTNDFFGFSTAISSDGARVFVGGPGDVVDTNDFQGSAYVYARQPGGGYTQAWQLVSSDGGTNDFFGFSVATGADGERVLVGGPGDIEDDNRNQGSAYLFTRQADGSYQQQAKLNASDGGADDFFGASVALSAEGAHALAGSPGDISPSDDRNQGSAYVFDRQADGSYQQVAHLTASDGEADDFFGTSVALSADGERALVGAPGDLASLPPDSTGDVAEGSAYVFDRQADGSYQQQAQLTASDAGSADFFGFSVAISPDGERLLVGGPGDVEDGNANEGSAYAFARQPDGSYTQEKKLTAPDGEAGDFFGFSVALSAEKQRALVGAPGDLTSLIDVIGLLGLRPTDSDNGLGNGLGNDLPPAGSAYVFARQSGGSYTQRAQLSASDATSANFFGASTSISADGLRGLVGAPGDVEDGNAFQGSAYVYGPASLPVELVAPPTATAEGRDVVLSWRTLSETNNRGFRVEHRRIAAGASLQRLDWSEAQKSRLVKGAGQASTEQRYELRVRSLTPGRYAFRIAQEDFDGGIRHSRAVRVEVDLDDGFALGAPGPNPFRVRTTLAFAVPEESEEVEAALYNSLGQRVRSLDVGAGEGRIEVRAGSLASGLYVVRLTAGGRTATQTIMLAR